MPQISIIIPVYNVEKYLHRCVDSILAQTFTDFELILVDDGSPDNCGAICDCYMKQDSRVKVIHQKNQGQAAARNHGIAYASGRWIHFVDSDDFIHPQMLETLYRMVQETHALIGMCHYIAGDQVPKHFFDLIPDMKEFERRDVNENTIEEIYLLSRNSDDLKYSIVCAKLIAADIVRQIPFDEGHIYEDTAVVPQWMHLAGKIAWSNEPLYFYWINPSSTMNQSFSPKRYDKFWSWEVQREFYERIGYLRMRNHMKKAYVSSGVEMLRVLSKAGKGQKDWHRISKMVLKKYRESERYNLWTNEEKRYILSMLYPRLAKIYWYACAVKRRIKRIYRSFC